MKSFEQLEQEVMELEEDWKAVEKLEKTDVQEYLKQMKAWNARVQMWTKDKEEARQKMAEEFEAILERYDMPKQANWKPLQDFVLNWRKYKKDLQSDKQGLMYMDAEAIICLIWMLQAGGKVFAESATGERASLNEANFRKYLELSLHKLLWLMYDAGKHTEEERKNGFIELITSGESAKIGIREELQKDGAGFTEPYSESELEGLLDFAKQLKQNDKIKKGRGKNAFFFGDKLATTLASIPESVKAEKRKTDLLNFAGEMMDLAGILKDADNWNKYTKQLRKAEEKGWETGDDRRSRMKLLESWLKSAKQMYCKTDFKHCEQCDKQKDCDCRQLSKFFDV